MKINNIESKFISNTKEDPSSHWSIKNFLIAGIIALLAIASGSVIFAIAKNPRNHEGVGSIVPPVQRMLGERRCLTSFSPLICPADSVIIPQNKLVCRPTQIDPYFEKVDQKIREIAKRALRTPPYIDQYLHPGISLSLDGEFGYYFQEDRQMLNQGELEISRTTISNMLSKHPEIEREIKRKISRDQSPKDHKGLPIDTKSGLRFLTHCIREKKENHRAMMSELRTWIGIIEQLTPQEIAKKILHAHRILFNGIFNKKSAGAYRKENIIVFRDDKDDRDRLPENLIKLIRTRGGSEEDVEVFKKMIEKQEDFDDNTYEFTKREREAARWVFSVTPNYQDVPKLTIEFAKHLREAILEMKQCKKNDPIAIGAFIHRKVGEIHPFVDGNGRIARALMNAVLLELGHEPVIFFNDSEYTDAVMQDFRQPGSFATYLREIAIPRMQRLSQFLDQF